LNLSRKPGPHNVDVRWRELGIDHPHVFGRNNIQNRFCRLEHASLCLESHIQDSAGERRFNHRSLEDIGARVELFHDGRQFDSELHQLRRHLSSIPIISQRETHADEIAAAIRDFLAH
jgi:hypothetical protein